MGLLSRLWRGPRTGRVWIVGVVGLLLLSFWMVSSSESCEYRRAGEKSDYQDAAFNNSAAPAPSAQGDSLADCLDYFLEENEPGIAALSVLLTTLFTGVLAISTIGLWNSTRNLHEETKRVAALAEAQSKDMKACIEAAQKSREIAEPSETATRSDVQY